MTAGKDTHDTDNGGLDSRAGLENDGGERRRGNDPRLPRPSFSPSSPSVILASRRESRLVLSMKNWIPGDAPRMTAGKDTHDTDNGGLDSRAGLENDGGERHRGNDPRLPRPSFSPPSPSVILASRRESRLVFPIEELDSRARPENDGGEEMRGSAYDAHRPEMFPVWTFSRPQLPL